MTPHGSEDVNLPWHQRLHAALMPDYNRAATIYWWTAAVTGWLLLLGCLASVGVRAPGAVLQVAVGVALAISAGMFPVRLPGTKVSFAAGEICIFLVLMLQGPAAAAIAAAAESGTASLRTSKRWTSRLGSPAMAALAMYAAGSLFTAVWAALIARAWDGPVAMLALAIVFGSIYFLASATMLGGVGRLRRGENLFRLSDATGAVQWVGLAYSASAVASTLLFIVYRQAGTGVFLITLPLLVMLLLVLHFYYRQQEAREAMQQALAELAEREAAARQREAELTQRHGRELQLSERRFRSAFTYASIGMALLDLDGRVLQANESLAKLLGRPVRDLAGVRFSGVLDVQDAPQFDARVALARGVDFEDFEMQPLIVCDGQRPRRLRLSCTFFRGPADHGASQPGRPCLLLQLQDGAT